MPYFVTEHKSKQTNNYFILRPYQSESSIIYSNGHDCTLSRVLIYVNGMVLPGGKTVTTPAVGVIRTYKNSSLPKCFPWTDVPLSLHAISLTKQP
jgi:hypothetical protein